MIVSFRCPPKLKQRVDCLVEEGAYPDASSFFVTAVENQLLLEEQNEHSRDAQQRQSPLNGSARSARRSPPARSSQLLGDVRAAVAVNRETQQPVSLQGRFEESAATPLPLEPSVPSELARIVVTASKVPFSLPSVGSDLFQPGQRIPIRRWLWGQYNRLLPAKVSMRALARISLEGRDALVLDGVSPRIANTTSVFGDYLRVVDRRSSLHRDDALATAFPDSTTEGQKGRVRYQNHFVGHTVRGEQGGMLIDLKLATIQVLRNKPHLLPTTAGWEFAWLPNPVLDGTAEKGATDQRTSRLSGQEIDFLLAHIERDVPVECFAFRTVLSLISEGVNTPITLNERLAPFLVPDDGLDILKDYHDFISTQKNGVIGRLSDLLLVERERTGTRILYRVTERGAAFISGSAGKPAEDSAKVVSNG